MLFMKRHVCPNFGQLQVEETVNSGMTSVRRNSKITKAIHKLPVVSASFFGTLQSFIGNIGILNNLFGHISFLLT